MVLPCHGCQSNKAAIKELEGLISSLQTQVGLSPDDSTAAGRSAPETVTRALKRGGDVAALVGDMEFYGMQSTKAARVLLERVGRERPLKTSELFLAIKDKGGVKISSEDALYRSLHRSKVFHNVGGGRWGLAEWYPESVTRRRDTGGGDASGSGSESAPSLSVLTGDRGGAETA